MGFIKGVVLVLESGNVGVYKLLIAAVVVSSL